MYVLMNGFIREEEIILEFSLIHAWKRSYKHQKIPDYKMNFYILNYYSKNYLFLISTFH